MFFQGNLGQGVATAMQYKLCLALLKRDMHMDRRVRCRVDQLHRSSVVLRFTPDNVNFIGVSLVSCMSFVIRGGLEHSVSTLFPDSWEDGSS